MMHRRDFLLALGIVSLAGCTREPAAAPTPSEPSRTPSPTELDGVSIKPDPTDSTADGGPEPQDASKQDEEDAIAAAEATMTLWVQGSTLDETQWREQINATLTTSGQENLTSVWGYRIPDTALEGTPEIARANAGSAVVRVTTDYTSYDVTVVKSGSEWLTSNVATIGEGGR